MYRFKGRNIVHRLETKNTSKKLSNFFKLDLRKKFCRISYTESRKIIK